MQSVGNVSTSTTDMVHVCSLEDDMNENHNQQHRNDDYELRHFLSDKFENIRQREHESQNTMRQMMISQLKNMMDCSHKQTIGINERLNAIQLLIKQRNDERKKDVVIRELQSEIDELQKRYDMLKNILLFLIIFGGVYCLYWIKKKQRGMLLKRA